MVTVVGYDMAVMWVNRFNQYYKCNIYINILPVRTGFNQLGTVMEIVK